MSCEEKERRIGKKGEGPRDAACGLKVIKKEKKRRRLILSDSESDEFPVSRLRRISQGADQKEDISSVRKKNAMERMNQKDEILVHEKKVTRSGAVNQSEEVVADKKKIIESALERRREAPEIPREKIKMDSLKRGRDKMEAMGGKKLKIDSLKRGKERGQISVGQSLGSRLTVPAGREQDGMKQKQTLSNPVKSGKSEFKNIRWKGQLGQQTQQVLKGKIRTATAENRVEGGISLQKGVRIQGRDRVLPSDKVSGLEKGYNRRSTEERSMTLESPRIAELGISMQPSVPGERKVLTKSNSRNTVSKKEWSKGKNSSSVKDKHVEPKSHQKKLSPQRKSSSIGTSKQTSPSRETKVLDKSTSRNAADNILLNKEQIASSKKNKFHELKSEQKVVSPRRESKHVDVSASKTDLVVKEESCSSLKTLPTKQNTNEESVGRNTAKQKIRDQIKNMLLNAGWRIDLRPRRNRNYEDSVYVSPWGTGYWSITKAYEVFQDQLNCARGDQRKDISEKSSKMLSESGPSLQGTGSLSPAIPMDLSMLRRRVVSKRGHEVKLEQSENKLGDGRQRKAKDKSKMRNLDKPLQERIEGIKGRKKLNHSSNIVGSTAHKYFQTGRNRQKGHVLLARGANQEAEVENDDHVPYAWKRTVLSWMIDLGVVPVNGKVKYMNKKKTQAKLEGWITRDGIRCGCCSKTLTVSKFELHAGSKLHQPYQNIFVEDSGVSLLQCQLNAWEKQDESERQGFYNVEIDDDDPNDDTCGICGYGGDLICCDGCPSTFHMGCLGIEMLPSGDWHCTNCSCRFCGLVSHSAVQESGVPVFPLLSCTQCKEKYHQDCIPEADAISVDFNNSETSFCGESCRKVYKQLHKILGVRNDLEEGFSWSIIHHFDEDTPESIRALPQWVECNSKIAVAFAVMDECFVPIIDQRSGINLIHNVVYNCRSNFNRLNYCGFYTFILEQGDEIISAASIRIHGTRLAEMPFIGTRNMYRHQGMCHRLLNGVESALCSLNVEKLIIPAISELKDTWTTVFGFKPLEIPQEQEIKFTNMLVLPGTGLLQKPLLIKHSDERRATAYVADKLESDVRHYQMLDVANESPALSIIEADLHGSNVVHCEHQVKDAGTSSPEFVGCMVSPPKMPSKSSDAYGSEVQTLKYKSSETADDVEVNVHPVSVYQDPVSEDESREDFSIEPTTGLYSKGTVDDNHEGKTVNAGSGPKLHDVNDALLQHISDSEAKCMSLLSIPCTLQESGEYTSPRNPAIDGHLLQHNVKAYFTSSDMVGPTLQESAGNNLQIPVCFLRSSLDPTLHCRPEMSNKSQSPFSVVNNFQESSELILDGNHDVKDPFPTSKPNLDAFDDRFGCCNSEVFDGTIVPVAKESILISVKPDVPAVDGSTVPGIHELKTESASVEPKPYANEEDSEPWVIENASGPLNATVGRENITSGISVTHDSDITTKSICPGNSIH